MEIVSSTATFGGEIRRVKHHSSACDCDMIFGIFLPPQAKVQKVPVLYWLSGLTCTDENFMIKAGAQRSRCRIGDRHRVPGHQSAGHRLTGRT